MKVEFKNGLIECATRDLSQTHPFAFERVGYLLAEFKNGILVFNEWMHFEDFFYEENEEVGARIGGEGMTFLMKKVVSSKKHFFHTHLHDFQDLPAFSGVDMRSLLEVTPSLFDFSGFGPHGAFLIGRESSRLIWWDENSCKNKKELIIDYGLEPRSDYEREK